MANIIKIAIYLPVLSNTVHNDHTFAVKSSTPTAQTKEVS